MGVLNFEIEQQQRDQWCWAAVAASICRFYQDNPAPTQCTLANQFLLPGEDCCEESAGDDCNIPFAVDLVLNRLGHLVLPPRGVVGFADLNQAITDRQPVVVRIMFSDFITAHFVVVVGCAIDDSGTEVVKIADPSQGAGNITLRYSALVNDFKPDAIWDKTYFTAKSA